VAEGKSEKANKLVITVKERLKNFWVGKSSQIKQTENLLLNMETMTVLANSSQRISLKEIKRLNSKGVNFLRTVNQLLTIIVNISHIVFIPKQLTRSFTIKKSFDMPNRTN